MRLELFPFQDLALKELHKKIYYSSFFYKQSGEQQVISFTAPTGAGKTIIMAALFENIFYGTAEINANEDAVILWLSDSPELNEQSKDKIFLNCDRITGNQIEMIEESTFDQDVFDDGMIYFLNTQKLSISSNLTKEGDKRENSIWKTINNTILQKGERFYLVIDEAHRGAKESIKQTTIMQKFVKGSFEDNLNPLPIIIGMSATVERFNKLIEGTPSTIHKVVITSSQVRASGLLKDRIIVKYPNKEIENKRISVLLAATDEWVDKWNRWRQYCVEQHCSMVYPILLIQVENSTVDKISDTNLDEVLSIIENRTNLVFKEGEVVHAFGDFNKIEINGLSINYKQPSEIQNDKKIKVVFYKESLSTGWDCPRAEVMISFRKANDATYISQLLGRMVRTPTQSRILVDETLNDVQLFLPFFDENTVNEVLERFRETEGNEAISEIDSDSINDSKFENWSVIPNNNFDNQVDDSNNVLDENQEDLGYIEINKKLDEKKEIDIKENMENFIEEKEDNEIQTEKQIHQDPKGTKDKQTDNTTKPKDKELTGNTDIKSKKEFESINRLKIIKYINTLGISTYTIRKVRINNYLTSLFKLSRLLNSTGIDVEARKNTLDEIIEMIEDFIKYLKDKKLYEEKSKDVRQFKLSKQIFEIYGDVDSNKEKHIQMDMYSSSDFEIEAQFRRAEQKLGNEGIANAYGKKNIDPRDPSKYQIDVILFASDDESMSKLNSFATKKFNELNDKYRIDFVNQDDSVIKEYENIIKNSDEVTKSNFRLSTNMIVKVNSDDKYYDHLFIDGNKGYAKIDLNSWEKEVLNEERNRDDFITWLRNLPRKSSSLTIPYEKDNEIKPAYPDLIIVRKRGEDGYVLDVLEPHGDYLDDNLAKAKGFAKYAEENKKLGRVQLIRKSGEYRNNNKYIRLDLSKGLIREKVLKAINNEELTHIFETDGESDI